jgi:hypothetical protein
MNLFLFLKFHNQGKHKKYVPFETKFMDYNLDNNFL